jgi:hypothetical protein
LNSGKHIDQDTLERVSKRALDLWSDRTYLKFDKVNKDQVADIQILFATGDHHDDYPFDGPGFILAHGEIFLIS